MRPISGRLRAYDATMPAIVPIAKAKMRNTAAAAMRHPRPRRRARLRFATGHRAQHAVDETAGIFGRESLRQFHRFVDRYRRRRVWAAVYFKRSHLQE